MEKLLTKKEVAEVLRCSERQIDRLRESRAISCIKNGVSVLFAPAEVTRYIEANTVRTV